MKGVHHKAYEFVFVVGRYILARSKLIIPLVLIKVEAVLDKPRGRWSWSHAWRSAFAIHTQAHFHCSARLHGTATFCVVVRK